MDISIGGAFTSGMSDYARREAYSNNIRGFGDINADKTGVEQEKASFAVEARNARPDRPEGQDRDRNDPSKTAQPTGGQKGDSLELSPEAKKMLEELKARDKVVRAHEAAHVAAGSGVVKGGAQFTTQRGPDGNMYAVGGEVAIDASEVPNDQQATITKARQIAAAALAPADPSPQDRNVAASARQMEAKAAMELARNANGTDNSNESGGTSGTNQQNASAQDMSVQGRQAVNAYNAFRPESQGSVVPVTRAFLAVA